MQISSNNVKVCEEFELIFTYTGEGRFMQKPDLRDFYITGKPFVSFRDVYRLEKLHAKQLFDMYLQQNEQVILQ